MKSFEVLLIPCNLVKNTIFIVDLGKKIGIVFLYEELNQIKLIWLYLKSNYLYLKCFKHSLLKSFKKEREIKKYIYQFKYM